MFPSEHVEPAEVFRYRICNAEVPAMKPDTLDTAVVNHRMDKCTVQQRSHNGKDTEKSPTDKRSSNSPTDSDVIFESWDMVCIIPV